MLRSWRLGRVVGIPIYLHASFLLLPLLSLAMTRADGLAAVLFSQLLIAAVFFCVVLHELGHALMARMYGIATEDITLYPIGGVARLRSTGNRPHEEVAIALAGPAVNLAIVFLLAPVVLVAFLAGAIHNPSVGFTGGLSDVCSFLASLVTAVWLGNGVLMAFNLLPVFPMDGGRVLRAVLSLAAGRLRATEIAATLGLLAAGLLFFAGAMTGNLTLCVVPVFLAVAGQAELAALRRQERRQWRAALAADDFEEVPTVQVALPADTALPARPVRPDGFTGFLWDRENRVWVRWVDGRPIEA